MFARRYLFRLFKTKSALLIVCMIVIIVIFITVSLPVPSFITKVYYWYKPEKSVFCHSMPSINSLPDISLANPKQGSSIFFHETSCTSFLNGKVTINSRQACAVESAAKMNPNHEIYLMYASPGRFINDGTPSDRFLNELRKYPNVHIHHMDMERYLRGTPVENLWRDNSMSLSQYAQSHTSDVLRYLTLWKYGGIYLDLDVIVIQNLDNLGADYAGAESEMSVAAGIISFNHTGLGHELATSCINDLRDNFKGDDWGYNGPGTVTRLSKRICKEKKVKNMLGRDCQGFKVYPPYSFYAVPWWDWKWFFDPTYMDEVKSLTNNSYIIHVWNKFSVEYKIPLDSNTPYLHYAKKFCPNIVKECDEYF